MKRCLDTSVSRYIWFEKKELSKSQGYVLSSFWSYYALFFTGLQVLAIHWNKVMEITYENFLFAITMYPSFSSTSLETAEPIMFTPRSQVQSDLKTHPHKTSPKKIPYGTNKKKNSFISSSQDFVSPRVPTTWRKLYCTVKEEKERKEKKQQKHLKW